MWRACASTQATAAACQIIGHNNPRHTPQPSAWRVRFRISNGIARIINIRVGALVVRIAVVVLGTALTPHIGANIAILPQNSSSAEPSPTSSPS